MSAEIGGGVGMRDMHCMNKASVMKLGWSIMNDMNGLWTCVLRCMYGWSQECTSDPKAKGKDSPLWKAIYKVWSQVRAGTMWSVGNGRRESPLLELKDVWLDGYGALSHHTTHELSEAEGNATVADMVNERNHWKWELFAHLLPVQVVLVLASHSAPSNELEGDASY